MKSRAKPIVWGVDLTEKDPRDFHKMAEILGVWNRPRADVIPVAILGPLKGLQSKLISSLQVSEAAQEQFNQLLQQVAAVGVKDLKIYFQKEKKQRAIQSFLEHAAALRAGMVAVQTHSRRGFKRFQLGSFAEALIGCSPVPVFAVNPQTLVPPAISTIVFASKLIGRPDSTFKQTLKWAKERKAELVIYHKFENPIPLGAYGSFGLVVDAPTNQIFVDDQLKLVRQNMKIWVNYAKKAGVKCRGVIFNELGRIAEGVLLTAQDYKANVIVMATHRGPLGQRLLGSAAREVLMTSSCPVIVVHERGNAFS